MVFERQTHWLEQALDAIADRYQDYGKGTYLELHAAPMRNRKEGWEAISAADRAQATADVLRLLQGRNTRPVVFAAVIEKSQMLRTADILPYCYEILAAKVDEYLTLKYRWHKEAARGIFVLDRKHGEEANMQALHRTFKHIGHGNGKLRNFAEVPMFIDSKATRLIQFADTICYWIYRRYEAGDDRGWQMIQPHFAGLSNGRSGLHEVLAPATPEKLATPLPQTHPFPPALIAQPVATRSTSPRSLPLHAPIVRTAHTALITH